MKNIGMLLLAVLIIGGCTKSNKSTFPMVLTVPFFEDVWGGAAYGVTCDSSDNVYVVGNGYNSPMDQGGVAPAYWGIRKFSPDGTEVKENWCDNSVTAFPNGWNRPYAVTTDGAGNVYVAGTIIDSSNPSTDWYIMKFDSTGMADTVNWNKQYGTIGEWDEAFGLGIDSSGDIYVAGYGTNVDNVATGEDWWIKKFNSGGTAYSTANWDIATDNGGTSFEYVQSIGIDGDDNIWAICIKGADHHLALEKYDSDGNELWSSTLTIQYDTIGSYNSNGQRVAFDSSGNVYFVGSGKDVVNGSSGNDWIVKKFNSIGVEDLAWDKALDGGGDAEAFAVAVDSGDNVYVVGYGVNLYSSTSGRDWWIKKYSSDGTEVVTGWDKKIHGGHTNASAIETAYGVAVDSDDNVYVVGTVVPSAGGNIWRIMKYGSDGTELYSK
ncbi:MAG TPA: hypothetical protein PKX40_03370 [Spirochaetota bacterium]|nr:hypothetical protein [Spirochaetota bacterium]